MEELAQEFGIKVQRLVNTVVEKAAIRMERVAVHLADQTKLILRGERHGRVYRVPNTKGVYLKDAQGNFVIDPKRKRRRGKVRYYTASAPSEPPASPTGRLRNSIQYVLYRAESGSRVEITAMIGSNVEYARWLEHGSKFMAPRPYLRPTWLKERNWVKDQLKRKYL